MTDPRMNRTDWLNESWEPSDAQMQAVDGPVREEVAELLTSLIAIAPAVTRSELEKAIEKLRKAGGYAHWLNSAIDDVLDVVEHYHKRLLETQRTGRPWDRDGFRDDLRARLEDFE